MAAILFSSVWVPCATSADPPAGASTATFPVTASGCFLLIKQQAAVPARDRGVLEVLDVEPGVIVERGQSLGRLESIEAELALQSTRLELAIAEKELADSLKPEIASIAVEEAREKLVEAQAELATAEATAESDIAIQIARNAVTLAAEEYERSVAARQAFRSSVSDMEITKLGLIRDEKKLRVSEAVHNQRVAELTADSRRAAIGPYERTVRRLLLEADAATREEGLSKLNIQRLQASVELADEQLRKRAIEAPFPGLIVEKQREVGEWVEPGDAVFRLVRLDHLLVEGYVAASMVSQATVGTRVSVVVERGDRTVEAEGRVVFVSPEVDRVNMEVQVRAEIPNEDLSLRPGQPATMTIYPGS